MPRNNDTLLVDYLDKNLSPQESAEVETLLHRDKQFAAEWEYLKMAVEAIELEAIREQVHRIHPLPARKFPPLVSSHGKVRSMYQTTLQIAAILTLLLAASIFYKYSTVNNASMYHEYFTDYTLNTPRGESNQNAIENAYRNKNWNEVITAFNGKSVKTNKSYFLAAMAALKLKEYPDAVSNFENILYRNAKSGDKYFQDEAEYYLALAYLMNRQTDKGLSLLHKIRGNKEHLYYPLARRISYADLKIIEIKNNK